MDKEVPTHSVGASFASKFPFIGAIPKKGLFQNFSFFRALILSPVAVSIFRRFLFCLFPCFIPSILQSSFAAVRERRGRVFSGFC